jgi:hypothetical protein
VPVTLVLGEIAWWGPIAIIGGGVLGFLAGYLLLAFVGTPSGGSGAAERIRYERTSQTNYTRPNPAALVAAFCIVALVVGLAIGLSAD